MPTLPPSEVTRLELDGSGALQVDGQIVDKIQEVQPSKVITPHSNHGNRDGYPISLTTFPETRNFVRVVIDRDGMVMNRAKTHRYPNGDSILNAYRKAACTGQEALSDKEAEKGFDALRTSMIGAKGTTVRERTFGMDLSLGVGTTLAIVFGSIATQTVEARTTWQLMADNLFTRAMAWTEKGYLGIVPAETEVGDFVVLLNGGRMPFILRPQEDAWRLLGPSYVHGIMGGELSNRSSVTTFKIA